MKRPPRPPRSKPLLRDDSAALQSHPMRKRDPAQPHLPFDPMPDRVEPALAVLKPKPPRGPEWAWEIKWDGYRIAVHASPSGVKVITRGGLDWTSRFPVIAEAARALGSGSMILDGEAVMGDEAGRSDFNLLQKSLGASGKHGGALASPAIMFAFDLLYFDGHDLRRLSQQERRQLLETVIPPDGEGGIQLSDEFDADPVIIFEQACALGLEGIVGKRRDSPYRSGRTGDWVKIKCVTKAAFVIVGYEPGRSFGGFSRLLLAAYEDDQLRYVGGVGTGFKEQDTLRLGALMDKLPWRRKQPPVGYSGRSQIVWLQPKLIADIEFRGWTRDNKLRHSSFKRLAERQDHADVYRL
ncbi:non-homologous end-joining DNA ligase [Rhizobium sp. BK650]|uniref:non-homologous end-joining DNA ligase n=1 Tax=Rhizobium sp. BK650 TaxID=2586990 RepID=UPI00161758C1|nr:non-homologous end-joining DNA ligase [Rhizobium sp. BK650]